MKQVFTILFLLTVSFLFGQISTTFMYDDINSNFSGTGLSGVYRNLGTPSWKFVSQANFTGSNFYKVYNQSNNNNNDFNNPSGSKVWSGSLTIDNAGTAFAYGDGNGGAGSYAITNGRYYIYCWEDVSTSNDANALIMETSNQPVTISSVVQSPSDAIVDPNTAISVTVTLSGAPSTEENLFIRYSIDNFATYGTLISPTSGSGTATQGFSIPGQVDMTTLRYYVFTTTLSSGTINNDEALTDLATIEINNSGGTNFSVQFLPVELTSFIATPKGRQTALYFSTASEINNDYFEVQHSVDGRNWKAIGKVEGAGTTQQQQEYHFVDRYPLSGINYYRLKQVDFDGQFEYSEVLSVQFDDKVEGVDIYPNPAQDVVHLNLPAGTASIKLLDATGRLVKQLEPGLEQTRVEMGVQDLSSGTYYLMIYDTTEELINTQKLVKGD